jgi:hypothetical protein
MSTEHYSHTLFHVRVGCDISNDKNWVCRITPYRANLMKKVFKLESGSQIKVSELMAVQTATVEIQPSRYTYCEEHRLEEAKALLAAEYRKHVAEWQLRFSTMLAATDMPWEEDFRTFRD